jgi:hypothetical protein
VGNEGEDVYAHGRLFGVCKPCGDNDPSVPQIHLTDARLDEGE